MTCRNSSSIQQESQPANAIPPMLESVCKSVESEADPLNQVNFAINFASVKYFFLATPLDTIMICICVIS